MFFCSTFQIRKKLISKQAILEKSEKAKKLREQRKFGKKVGYFFCISCYCTSFIRNWQQRWRMETVVSILDHPGTSFHVPFCLPGSNRGDPEETEGEEGHDVGCKEIPERWVLNSSVENHLSFSLHDQR